MDEYLELERRFALLKNYSADELFASELRGESLPWSRVLDGRFSVIVGRANFGKTMEFKAKSRALRIDGRATLYVALQKVLGQDVFADALDIDDRDALDAWKASGGELTVFVDSLDEAALGTEDGICKALRRLSRQLDWPTSQVRWVLSSRPAVLSEDVLAILQKEFRTSLYTIANKNAGEAAEFDSAFDEAAGEAERSQADSTEGKVVGATGNLGDIASVDATSKTDDKKLTMELLKVYRLLPLDTSGAARYLKEHHNIDHAKEIISAARQYGLGRLADGPGSLDILAYIDPAKNPPQCLTWAFNKIVEAVQQQQRSDPRERRIAILRPESLDEAIGRLASASAVCQLPNIEISHQALRYRDGVLSARPLIASLLSEDSLAYLLGSRLFIDSGQHQVKLYPDELLPFLAAKRLAGLVKSPEHAHRLMDYFTWRATTGECGVHRALLPLAGWLGVFNSHCRQLLLDVEPQAVAFFGDLRHPEIPMHEASAALERSIVRLVVDGDSLGRRFYSLTAENFWQAAKPGIGPTLRRLYRKHRRNWRARDAILDIAAHARMDVLRDAVLGDHKWDYSKLLHEQLGLNYILTLGRDEDSRALAAALKGSPTLRESTVARVIADLAWKTLNAKSIAEIATAQIRKRRDSFSLDWVLTRDVAPEASDSDLYRLTRSLLLRLVNANFGKGRSAERYRLDEKFVELGSDLLALLIERRAVEATRAAKMCLLLRRHINEHHHSNADLDRLRVALNSSREVRLAFLRGLVRLTDRTSEDIARAVYWHVGIYQPVEGDEAELGEPGFTEFIAKTKQAATKPSSKPRRRRERVQVVDEESRAKLMGMLDGLRDASKTSALAWVAQWLSRTQHQSRHGECDFQLFERSAGREISQAVREGLSVLWRTTDPIWKEDEPNSTYNITMAGLQGLHLDLGDGALLPVLSESEVRRAIRYAQFEINGYPKWFWKLVAAHERVAVSELRAILSNASRGKVSFDKAETLIRHIDDAPTTVRDNLATAVWKFLIRNPQLSEYTSEAALNAAAAANGTIYKRTFETRAWRRISSAFNEALPVLSEPLATPTVEEHEERQRLDAKLKDIRRQRASAIVWGRMWLLTYPSTFAKRWEKWRATKRETAEQFMLALAAYFGEDHVGRLKQLAEMGSVGVKTLHLLYNWVRTVVREEEDIHREPGRVYSPGERDHAQRLRDQLVPAIAHAKSEEAYQVLDDLRRQASGSQANYLRYTQFMMREEQNARKPIDQKEYFNFEQTFSPPVTTYREFAMAVEADLLSVKSQIETGDFSLRRFFNSVNFQRIKTDNDGLALEEDFQSLLGSELNHVAAGRYTVALEPILPGGTRRDVLCQKDTLRATIELKMSMRWTLQDYTEALEKQLKGQYMMAPNSKIGFFVVVLQERRKWDGRDGKKIDFDELIRILSENARQKEIADSLVYLRVIGINATPAEKFRASRQRKVGRKKLATKKTVTKRAAPETAPQRKSSAKAARSKAS